MKRAIGSLGFLQGLRGYDAIVRATQFAVHIDLMTEKPVDAGSVQDAFLRAAATEQFGIKGWMIVNAKVVSSSE